MAVLENCEPKRVFHYFEEICKIPHGSGNTKQISDSGLASISSISAERQSESLFMLLFISFLLLL